MKIELIGKKIGMKSFFKADGKNIPVTMVEILSIKSAFDVSENKIEDLLLHKISTQKVVSVQGKTSGKGTCSNIKINHFKRGPESHGSKHHRLQGSLGAGTSPGRVFPGKKMPKKYGNFKATLKNIEIIDFDIKKRLIYLKGPTMGKAKTLLKII